MEAETNLVGKQFATFDEWRRYLQDYETKEREIFVIHNSEKLRFDELTESDEKKTALVYKTILYRCKFGNIRTTEATGVRQSSTYKQNCPACIRVSLSKDHKMLEIKKANLSHCNHPTSKVFCDNLPENRRLSPKTQDETMKLLSLGCNKKLLQTKLLDEQNKRVTLKDLSNIKAKMKQAGDESLPSAVKLLESQYGAAVKVLEEDNNFKGMFFVTEAMKRSMSAWPHIVLIDGTYKLLKSGLTLMLFIVQDSIALSEVVGVALLATENRPKFTWLLESFKEVHAEACSSIHCFMSDKDLLERDVLKEVFPGTPVYICRFHVLRTFSRAISTEKMKISRKEKDWSLQLLQKLVYSKSVVEYDELYEEFGKSAPTDVLLYFDHNWHPIREDWTAYSMVHGNLNNMTNNRIESMNAKIKQVVQKNSSLLEFIKSFFKWLQSHNLGVTAKTANTFLKRTVEKFSPDTERQQYRDVLMPLSATRVLGELDICKFVTNITCLNNHCKVCIIRSDDVDLKVSPLSCECPIWTSEFLPCRHIFSVRKYFGFPLFSSELCQPRCIKQYLLDNLEPNARLPIATPQHQTGPTISKVAPKKPVTATEKRKKVTPIVTELLNLAAGSCGSRFDCRLSVLQEICASWKEGYEVVITKSGALSQNTQGSVGINRDQSTTCRSPAFAVEATGNLSFDFNQQCSLSESGIDKPEPSNLTFQDNAKFEKQRLTVPSNTELTKINMPPAIKTFGRPARHLATTTNVVKRKHVAKRFVDKSNELQVRDILGWLIDGSVIDVVIRGEHLITSRELQLGCLHDAVADNLVDLELVARYSEITQH